MISPERISKFEAEKKAFFESVEGKKFINKYKNFKIDPRIPTLSDGGIDWEFFIDSALEYVSIIDFYAMTPIEVVRQIEAGRRRDCRIAKVGVKPESPEPPKLNKGEPGANPYEWLDWYDLMNRLGFYITLKEIAHRSGWSIGTIRKKHSQYIAEGGYFRSNNLGTK